MSLGMISRAGNRAFLPKMYISSCTVCLELVLLKAKYIAPDSSLIDKNPNANIWQNWLMVASITNGGSDRRKA